MEIWKKIEKYSSPFLSYYVSNEGRVKSVTLDGRETMLKPQKQSSGYLQVGLCKNGVVTLCLVHRLVGLHFLDLPKGKNVEELVVHHKDCNPLNNCTTNLLWCTPNENINTPECIAKMALSKSQKIVARNIETGEILLFDSMQETCETFGVHYETITKVVVRNERILRNKIPFNALFDFSNLHTWYSPETYITNISGEKWALYRVWHAINEDGEIVYTSPSAKRIEKKHRKTFAEHRIEKKNYEKEYKEKGYISARPPKDAQVLPLPFEAKD